LRRLCLALVAAAAALLLAGCGGGSSSGDAGGQEAELTKADWARRADAICTVNHESSAHREAELEALLKGGLTSPQRRDEAAELVRGAIPAVEKEARALSELIPPAAEATTTGTVIAELEETTAIDRDLAAALEHGSVHELEALFIRGNQNGTALEDLAQKLDLKVCGRSGEAD
jgi:hypothetical protein